MLIEKDSPYANATWTLQTQDLIGTKKNIMQVIVKILECH